MVRRLEDAIDGFAVAWLKGYAVGDNPAGIEIRHFDGATAAATVSRPDLDFMNRVHGLAFADPRVVDQVRSFYRSMGVRPWVELPPGSEELAARLADVGARPVDVLAVLFGLPVERPSLVNIEVHRVSEDDSLHFADLLLEGHGVGADARAVDAPAIARLVRRDDITFYLARPSGRDVAAGVLAIGDKIGYLANAATLAGFRGRGCHSALVRQRIADAAAAGCDLIASLTRFGSMSQRTLERAGLQMAYTKVVWRL